MEILLPHEKFLHGKFPPHNSPLSPQPLPQLKNPPENVCTLTNNHY